jgi:hypothetical protein
MLYTISNPNDELIALIKDDPVRPEIAADRRVNQNSRIFVLRDDQTQEPLAVTCVKFLDTVPQQVDDLVDLVSEATTAVFYTIWSYSAGAGRELIAAARREISQEWPTVNTYVTLSPKTEMARRFHLKNGATVYRENPESVNYLYD